LPRISSALKISEPANEPSYGSEKAIFDAASGAPSFFRVNGYGSENEAFFFAWSASIREK